MVSGVMIDLADVVYAGRALLPGADSALSRLDAAGRPVRFLTNATSKPRRAILADLSAMGLDVPDDHVVIPGQAARNWLADHDFGAHLLIPPDLAEDFEGCPAGPPRADIIGDARAHFTYAAMNRAFRELAGGVRLLALAANRAFKDSHRGLSIDAGAFVAALEYACGQKAPIMGKPAPAFFAAAAIASMGLAPEDTAMIGDNAEAGVAGARNSGFGTALPMRKGKYREGDAEAFGIEPRAMIETLSDPVEAVLSLRP